MTDAVSHAGPGEPGEDGTRPSGRAYVQLPEGYFQLSDDDAAAIDEEIAQEMMRQFGIVDG